MEGDQTEPLAWWTYVGVGALWWGSSVVLDQGGVTGEAAHLWLAAVFIATFGIACVYNGQQCGALHCRISGPAYVGVALLAAASALGWIDVSRSIVMGLFGGVFVLSYALEYLASARGVAPT